MKIHEIVYETRGNYEPFTDEYWGASDDKQELECRLECIKEDYPHLRFDIAIFDGERFPPITYSDLDLCD